MSERRAGRIAQLAGGGMTLVGIGLLAASI
jgi:hypothetical protein